MSYNGRCSCGNVQFRLNAEPMMTHACHCTQCQRVTGTAFVMNTVIEKDQVELVTGEPRSAHRNLGSREISSKKNHMLLKPVARPFSLSTCL